MPLQSSTKKSNLKYSLVKLLQIQTVKLIEHQKLETMWKIRLEAKTGFKKILFLGEIQYKKSQLYSCNKIVLLDNFYGMTIKMLFFGFFPKACFSN